MSANAQKQQPGAAWKSRQSAVNRVYLHLRSTKQPPGAGYLSVCCSAAHRGVHTRTDTHSTHTHQHADTDTHSQALQGTTALRASSQEKDVFPELSLKREPLPWKWQAPGESHSQTPPSHMAAGCSWPDFSKLRAHSPRSPQGGSCYVSGSSLAVAGTPGQKEEETQEQPGASLLISAPPDPSPVTSPA